MYRTFFSIVTILGIIFTSGCGTPIIPVIQVAGAAKTVYDYSDIVIPKERMASGQRSNISMDSQIERRMNERLAMEPVNFVKVKPHSYGGHVYLVGLFRNKAEADRALEIAVKVEGVKKVTCVFAQLHQPYSFEKAMNAENTLKASLIKDNAVKTKEVRVNVLQDKAVLLGYVNSIKEKDRIIQHAHNTQDITSVTAYLRIRQGPTQNTAKIPAQVASN